MQAKQDKNKVFSNLSFAKFPEFFFLNGYLNSFMKFSRNYSFFAWVTSWGIYERTLIMTS